MIVIDIILILGFFVWTYIVAKIAYAAGKSTR